MTLHRDRAHKAWRRAERIKRLSDRVVGLGPWGLGIDGVLAWVPVAGTAYSVGAAALLLSEAIQAGASRATLARMAAYLGLDSVASGVPIVGWALDTLFTGHAFAARALQRDVEKRFGRPADDTPALVAAGGARPRKPAPAQGAES
ncbi:DUF4112 domain-containing protein [Phenylobacterium sp.]|uniref:DUF4112 domain-containing protein n=1 Tax=Phenylobacterium sp. TaxID=1871053 RepID=UPI0025F126B0|nr:DUF4112 domain-containing protein [Phenylobacterium sp.]MBX3483750.1 DUF4112 domain-containing protein [Phenylobacterium sp.]MCW5759778.1 DUF4112 domain-containing protein [Phenylobacterium sp.]